MDEEVLSQSSYPLYAPLSIPIVKHLALRLMRAKRAATLNEARDLLLVEVQEKRNVVYFYMNPFVHNPAGRARKGDVTHYSTAWLLQTLTLHTPSQMPMLQDTLTKWGKRGLFRYRERGVPDYDTAAALLIARMVDRGERNFLPTHIKDSERLWWCWRQDGPNEPVIPCQFPPPEALPSSTLLWTDWVGASWDTGWIRVGESCGAIRWAGIRVTRSGEQRWSVPREALAAWDQQACALLDHLPVVGEDADQEEEERERFHIVAMAVLRRLAAHKFSTSPSMTEQKEAE